MGSITNFEIGLYLFTVFLTFFGIFFLYLSSQAPHRDQEKSFFRKILNIKMGLFLAGILYLAFAHLSVYSAMGLNLEYGFRAPCENVVANSTYVNSTFTTYSYTDSCLARTRPPISTTIFVIYTWLLFLDIIAVALGVFILFWDRVFKLW